MYRLNFATENLRRVFNTEGLYDQVKTAMFARIHGEPVFNADGTKMTDREADSMIRNVMFDVLNVESGCSPRTFHRALQDHGKEQFRVIEDVVDDKVATGFEESEFFNRYVEYKSQARNEENIFWTPDDTILSVGRIAMDHHDFSIQRLGKGQSTSVSMGYIGAEIGADIEKFRLGQYDWNRAIEEIAAAFVRKTQNMIYAELMTAPTKLSIPSFLQVSGNFTYDVNGRVNTTLKNSVDKMISDVTTANEGAPVTLIGTEVALKKLTYISDVQWASDAQKEAMSQYGRLGNYEGTEIMEIPQRFARDWKTQSAEEKRYMFKNDVIFAMPNVDNKFIKMYDSGETEIYEKTEKGDYQTDLMTYEIKRGIGVTSMLGKYFGLIKLV